jgi:hypothetical protein
MFPVAIFQPDPRLIITSTPKNQINSWASFFVHSVFALRQTT